MLHNIKAPKGANRKPKRVGRGESSGHGKTATRGGKGQTARKGNSKPRMGFEGGQSPMYRRVPKRGFTSLDRREYAVINVSDLEQHFNAGDVVDSKVLLERGIVKKQPHGVKLLGDGELKKKITFHADAFSASAKTKIEAAGGTITLVEKPKPKAAAAK